MADPLANYTLLDYGFELIGRYVHVKWFDGEQVLKVHKMMLI